MNFIGLLRTLEQITRQPRRGAESEDGEPVGEILCPTDGGRCCDRTSQGCIAYHTTETKLADLKADRGTGAINDGEPQQVTLSGREYERYLDGALNEPLVHVAEVCRAHQAEECWVCDEDNDDLWVHPRDVDTEPDDDDTPNPTEPGSRWCACGSQTCGVCRDAVPQLPLSDSELSAVRGLLRDYGPLINLQSSASAGPVPSPTIVQSAPPPTVDGEGSPADSGIPPSPAGERPTSELLTEAAVHLDYYLDRHETSITSCLNGRGFTRELRDRAATFEAIEE